VKMPKLASVVLMMFALTPGAFAAAQSNVTTADIYRLQDEVKDVSGDVAELRSRDTRLATQLENELTDASDEVTYLKVKLRKNEPVARSEYLDLRDNIDDIRARARGNTSSRNGEFESSAEVPVGTEFDVRLQNALNSETAKVEDRFTATTVVDLRRGSTVTIPAGSVVRGFVSAVSPAGHIDRTGSMTVSFDQITIDGRTYPMRGTVTKAIDAGVGSEVGKIGAGAGVGAILGGILGGTKGALAGILIGGGGVVAATDGDDVELPVGTVLRLRLDSPLDLP
jgi:hypothetical protein